MVNQTISSSEVKSTALLSSISTVAASSFLSLLASIISPCFQPKMLMPSPVRLIFWEGGATKILTRRIIAGEIMFQFPNMVVCHADSFYIGHPAPILSIEDKLLSGETYLVLPVDHFASKVLSVSSVSSMVASSPKHAQVSGDQGPFQYVKGVNGMLSIKVSPEFLTRLVSQNNGKRITGNENCDGSILISTPELKQHYDQLVGFCKQQVWSPKLETISEQRKQSSPLRFLGLDKIK